MIMRVLVLALFSFVAFGLSPGTLRNKELKDQNRMLKQTLQQLSEASIKGSLKNEMEKSVGVTYEDKGSSGMCYTETYTFDSSCQPGHNMILEDLGIFYAMWCCKPKSSAGMKRALKFEMEKSVGVKHERAVGGTCDHITEDNKSYSCNVYYKKIAKCPICQDDNAGAVDNSGITSIIGGRSRGSDGKCLSASDCEEPYTDCWMGMCVVEAQVGARELQVGTSGFCTQADLDRGCKQYRDCLCPPSEALTLLKSEERVGAKECRWCDCTHWDESSYSQCSPIANQEAGIYHTVKCREDGVTPMPGHWTSHDAECAKYSGGSSWFVGQAGDGKSCDAICGDQGMHCDKKGLEIQTKSELSSVCQQVTGWSGTAKGTRDIRPHTNTQTKACYGYDLWDSHPSSCSAVPTDPTYARICACV